MTEKTLSRRLVLCQSLAVGGGLWVSPLLSGCDAKKGGSPVSPAAMPAPAQAPASTQMPASASDSAAKAATPATSAKVTQASVQYQNQPKGDQKCSGCLHFIAESKTCKVVEGQINPEGWCTLWLKKA